MATRQIPLKLHSSPMPIIHGACLKFVLKRYLDFGPAPLPTGNLLFRPDDP
jgi:hypothetical protein